MAETTFGRNDAKTVKHYSLALSAQTFQKSFWGTNFMDTAGNKPIHRLMKLEREAGDTVTVDLFNNLSGTGVQGDNELKGNEESLTSATQQFWIDQLRHGVSLGGNMSRQRVAHDMRALGREKLSIWWSRIFDEAMSVYMTGTRGDETGDWLMAPGSVTPGTTKLYGNNTVTAVQDASTLWAGGVSADNTITADAGYNMTLELLDEAAYQLKTMANKPRPLMVGGKEKYVLVLHPLASHQLRTGSSSTWQEILKYSKPDQLFSGALGEYGPFMIYEHAKIPVVNNSATGVVYNLIMGAQAGFLAHGNAGKGLHFDWHEEVDDRGAKPVIDSGSIFGIQRAIYDEKDFATMLLKTTYGGLAS